MEFGDPMLGFCERRWLCDIVDDECSLSISIVHWCERGETFLACGIPDFKLDRSRGEVAFLREEGGFDGMLARLQLLYIVGNLETEDIPPIVGSLFSWKSLLTKRMTRED